MNNLEIYRSSVDSVDIKPTRTPKKTPIEKWELNKTSYKASVSAMCHQCMGGLKTDYINDIKHCSSTNCALFHVRPYKA